MLDRLKSTVRHTFIYSLSNIAPKVVGVILLPLFTAKLVQHDFGNWDLIDITIQILGEVLVLGQASAIILLNNSNEYKEKKESAFFTLTTFLLIIGSIVIIFAEGFTSIFSEMFRNSQIHPYYVRVSAYIVLLMVMNKLFLAKVQADEQSVFYTVVSTIRVTIRTIVTIYLVAYLNKGIAGILYAMVAGEIITTGLLLLKAIPQMQAKLDFDILKIGLKFGLPLVFGSAGFMLLNLSDRYIIKFLIGADANAVYGLGYRVAGVLNMFLVLPFSLGLLPIAYKYYGKPDDKRFYSKLMTYSTFFFIWGFVFVSLFGKEIISILADKPGYEEAYIVIPIILLSYVLSGMRLTSQLGMLLTKNTKPIAWITISAAGLNITMNFILIPIYGILAAAVDTLISFSIFYIITQIYADKYYKIPYENFKLALLIAIGTIFAAVTYFMPVMNPILEIPAKLIITAIFPLVLLPFGFYEKAELEIIRSPKKLMDFVKGIFSGSQEVEIDPEANIEQ